MTDVQDPFNMKVQKAPGGTKDKPQLVPSMYSERIVGCICKYAQIVDTLGSLAIIGAYCCIRTGLVLKHKL